jgi:hypothetical protein
MENWNNFADSVNNAFYFVIDKIFSIESFFHEQALNVGRVVLLIALLSAGLNYALTGQGLKENMIKIMKATVFFFIIITAYPRIIGWITDFTFTLASGSVGNDVETYFTRKLVTMNKDILQYKGTETHTSGSQASSAGTTFGQYDDNTGYYTYTRDTYNILSKLTSNHYTSTPELKELFSKIKQKRDVSLKNGTLAYTTFAPASVMQLLIMTADSALKYADNAPKKFKTFPDLSAIAKGLICAFFLILTGVFALIEYLVCFLEFALVASVGVLLLPLSIWEGSKFLTEGYIKAVAGFFLKLLFCNIAIFLLLFGYVSIFHIIGTQKFDGSVDQIAFIFFSCLLFFFICKAAPGVAQSLLTGSPTLNAAGAIGAVAGVAGAVAATAGLAKKAGGAVASTAGSVAGGMARGIGGAVGSLAEANAAKKSAVSEVADAGGDLKQQKQAGNKAFNSSIRSDIGDSIKTGALGLARSISGDKSGGTNPHSWRQDFANNLIQDEKSGEMRKQTVADHLGRRRTEGIDRGKASASKFMANNNLKKPDASSG